MAASDGRGRTAEQVRSEIASERDELATAVETLREELGEATNVAGKMREKLPVVAGGALATGFVVAGGIGATARYFARRGREGKEKARLGPFAFLDRR